MNPQLSRKGMSSMAISINDTIRYAKKEMDKSAKNIKNNMNPQLSRKEKKDISHLQDDDLDNVKGQTVKGANHTSPLLSRKEEIQKGCGKSIEPRKFINKNVTFGLIGVKCGYIWIDEVRDINEICLCPTCQARLDERIRA